MSACALGPEERQALGVARLDPAFSCRHRSRSLRPSHAARRRCYTSTGARTGKDFASRSDENVTGGTGRGSHCAGPPRLLYAPDPHKERGSRNFFGPNVEWISAAHGESATLARHPIRLRKHAATRDSCGRVSAWPRRFVRSERYGRFRRSGADPRTGSLAGCGAGVTDRLTVGRRRVPAVMRQPSTDSADGSGRKPRAPG